MLQNTVISSSISCNTRSSCSVFLSISIILNSSLSECYRNGSLTPEGFHRVIRVLNLLHLCSSSDSIRLIFPRYKVVESNDHILLQILINISPPLTHFHTLEFLQQLLPSCMISLLIIFPNLLPVNIRILRENIIIRKVNNGNDDDTSTSR